MGTALMVDSPERGVPWLYKGLVVWSFGWAFLDAFTIGANDVANAFANAVGSRTITHKQACMIACVGEFIGVMVLGSTVTDAVRTKMIQVAWFQQDPYVLALGMSCVNLGSGLWVLAATIFALPVSTTHAVVGAVLGIGIAAWGPNGVQWQYDGGFAGVVVSWFVSPLMSGILASIIYLSVKFLVLAHPDEKAVQRGILLMPFYFFISFGIVCGFMLMKGAPIAKNMQYKESVPITIGVALFFALVALIFVVPWVRRTIQDNENLPWYTMFYHWSIGKGQMGYYEDSTLKLNKLKAERDAAAPGGGEGERGGDRAAAPAQAVPGSELAYHQAPPAVSPTEQPATIKPSTMTSMPVQNTVLSGPYMNTMPYGMMPATQGMWQSGPAIGTGLGYGGTTVVGSSFGSAFTGHEILEGDTWYTKIGKTVAPGFYMVLGELDPEDAAMHAKSFQAYPKTEEMFKMLQLTTCLFFSISHGANDIANALAPLATVWLVYSKGELEKKAPVPYWLLAYGGFALDCGLVVMGHHIMAALGNKLTLQSPSRGFCIELGAMFTVMVFSRVGVPVSTTHCMTGATTGVGLCNGDLGAVNWKLLAVIFGGWMITCPAAGVVTGLVFWGLASTPHPMPGNGFFTGSYIGE